MEKTLLSQTEAAAFVSRSKRAIRRWVVSGLLKEQPGKLYHIDDLRKAKAERILLTRPNIRTRLDAAAIAFAEMRNAKDEYEQKFKQFEDIFTRILGKYRL